MSYPILNSFKRCPYAMRARMSIVRTSFDYEHREVILRDRPEHMMKISPKGTVPVMLLTDGTVIEESLEIMQYVLSWELSIDENNWVKRNDEEFKYHLDRYKYPNRYEEVDYLHHRNEASKYLIELDGKISEMLSINRPVIFDCVVDKAENCYPMIPSGKPHNQMLLGPEDEEEISSEGKVLV